MAGTTYYFHAILESSDRTRHVQVDYHFLSHFVGSVQGPTLLIFHGLA